MQDKHIQESTGIKAMLDKALQSHERLPMLEILMEKCIQQISFALRNLTSEPVDVSINQFNSLRFNDYFHDNSTNSTIAIFKIVEWENLGLLVFDNKLILLFIDILLGGKKSIKQHKDIDSQARKLTTIEQGIIRQLSKILLNELSITFEQIRTTTFTLESIETNPNFATIARPGDATIVFKIDIVINNVKSFIDLVIPYKSIAPIKDQLQQLFLGDKIGNDKDWEEMMFNTIHEVDLPIEAVIINKSTPLHEVVNLKIGDTIMMDQKNDDDVLLRLEHIPLFKCKLGKVKDKISVSLKNMIIE